MFYILMVSFEDGEKLPAETYVDPVAYATGTQAIAEATDLVLTQNAKSVSIYELSQSGKLNKMLIISK